jgi:hypothetical protein
VNYAVSGMLVHWLLHGDDGAHAAAFLAHLERERRGEGSADAFLTALGVSGPELDARLLRHVKQVRVR